jgi:hypothetical protein
MSDELADLRAEVEPLRREVERARKDGFAHAAVTLAARLSDLNTLWRTVPGVRGRRGTRVPRTAAQGDAGNSRDFPGRWNVGGPQRLTKVPVSQMLCAALFAMSAVGCTYNWHTVESAAGTFKFPCEPRSEMSGSVMLWGCEQEAVFYQVAAGPNVFDAIDSASNERGMLAAFVVAKKLETRGRVLWERNNDQKFPLEWLAPGPGEREYGVAFYRADHFIRITASHDGETLPGKGYTFLRTNRP